MATDTPASPRRPRTPRLPAGLTAAAALAAVVWWWLQPGPPPTADDPDPRLTYPTPYRNVRPEVKYVGDTACARCHEGHARNYAQHPMGRSFAPVAAAPVVERFDAAAH